MWYHHVTWYHYDSTGEIKESKGIYFICDNSYLNLPSLICPVKGELVSSRLVYFSTNLDSVCKDAEFTFGILKTRWKILEYGVHNCKLETVGDFLTSCILHSMMADSSATIDNQTQVDMVFLLD